ncbi:hypothetical protein HNQ60_003612 [Povalibacter uvarum]|uniref:Uncharacterized protein n=1 Tax=Povalibacter uvarum TaxID=732238 RepID=A0A841HS71_9GAMM|nr:hypothetical protein [Povalibacter uvarum]MBB6094725.1 hypothetical protein [Povalibacter uvarum]
MPPLAVRLMEPLPPPEELELELDDEVPEYEQYRGLPTLIDGNSDAEQVMGPVNVAYTKVPDFP